jgi:hypothetical protein
MVDVASERGEKKGTNLESARTLLLVTDRLLRIQRQRHFCFCFPVFNGQVDL